MPDITMCLRHECPKAPTCWRFSAEPNQYQSYSFFNFTVKSNGDVECDHFVPVR
jgi:hypothetical protein